MQPINPHDLHESPHYLPLPPMHPGIAHKDMAEQKLIKSNIKENDRWFVTIDGSNEVEPIMILDVTDKTYKYTNSTSRVSRVLKSATNIWFIETMVL